MQSGTQLYFSITFLVLTYSVSQLSPKTGFPLGHKMTASNSWSYMLPCSQWAREKCLFPPFLLNWHGSCAFPENNSMHWLAVFQESGVLIQSLAPGYNDHLVKPEPSLNLGDRTSFPWVSWAEFWWNGWLAIKERRARYVHYSFLHPRDCAKHFAFIIWSSQLPEGTTFFIEKEEETKRG